MNKVAVITVVTKVKILYWALVISIAIFGTGVGLLLWNLH